MLLWNCEIFICALKTPPTNDPKAGVTVKLTVALEKTTFDLETWCRLWIRTIFSKVDPSLQRTAGKAGTLILVKERTEHAVQKTKMLIKDADL